MLRQLLSDMSYRARAIFRRGAVEQELDDELRFHIERQADELERRGLARDEALRQARVAFGGLEPMKEATRDAHGTGLLESVLQDLRYAFRVLRREPGFTIAVVLILGLGIGANVSTFSVMNALMLRPLPVPHAEQLVIIGDPDSVGSNWHGSPEYRYVSYPVYQDVRDRNHALSGLYASGNLNTPDVVFGDGGGAVEHPRLRAITGNFFSVLQVPALAGRTITADDDRVGKGAPVIVISHGYWQRRFGADRAVVGRNLIVNGQSLTIVGVTPPSFEGDVVGLTVDGWVPMAIVQGLQPTTAPPTDRAWSWLQMMGRLAPGVSLERARSELASIVADSIRTHATGDTLTEFEHDLKEEPIRVESGWRGFSHDRRAYGPALTVVMSAVALVVLIVCANVTNLLIVRGVVRAREMTVRITLGASRARLVRQLLTESVLLAAAGGALGLYVARIGSPLLLTMAGSGETAIPLDVTPDARVLAFTAVVTLLAALLFGLVPATRATRIDTAAALRTAGRSLVGARARFGRFAAGKALVVVQIALSTVLLIGAGLLVRSMQRVFAADLGFDRDHVVVVDVSAQKSGHGGTRSFALMRELMDRLGAVPSVTSVSTSMHGLFSGGWGSSHIEVPGFTPATLADAEVGYDAVGPGFFRAIGARIVKGRDIDARDSETAARVAVINQSAAAAYFRGVDPIGHMIRERASRQTATIVGVVADVHDRSIRGDIGRRVFYPIVQVQPQARFVLAVHVSGDSARSVSAIRQALLASEPKLVFEISPVNELIRDSVAEDRLTMRVTTIFSVVALLLAALGLYSVTAYATSQRTSEFGLRMALGAEPRSVTRLILVEGTRIAALGLAIGIPAGLAATRLIRGQLFDVRPIDPPSLALAIAVLAAMALLASYIPARLAARIAPLDALRVE